MRPNKLIISRTDSIGDVILTLPVAGILKQYFPDLKIIFLGRTYTFPVINACEHVDDFLNMDELEWLNKKEALDLLKEVGADSIIHVFPYRPAAKLARKAGIPLRIGTLSRFYHWFTCNKLLPLKRKQSKLHEAQLNLKLLQPFGIRKIPSLEEMPNYYGLTQIPELIASLKAELSPVKFNLILHPHSQGSAMEWPIMSYARLIKILPENEFEIFITGTEVEGQMIRDKLPLSMKNVHDLTGKMDLEELVSFVNEADGLVAASTGPLHIAAATGKKAIGLFSPKRPINPQRWAPLGPQAKALVYDENCPECAKGKPCNCIQKITPEQVMAELVV